MSDKCKSNFSCQSVLYTHIHHTLDTVIFLLLSVDKHPRSTRTRTRVLAVTMTNLTRRNHSENFMRTKARAATGNTNITCTVTTGSTGVCGEVAVADNELALVC